MTGIEWVKMVNGSLNVDNWNCHAYIDEVNRRLNYELKERLRIEGQVSLLDMYYRALELLGLDPENKENFQMAVNTFDFDVLTYWEMQQIKQSII